jgi:hypothetical protein
MINFLKIKVKTPNYNSVKQRIEKTRLERLNTGTVSSTNRNQNLKKNLKETETKMSSLAIRGSTNHQASTSRPHSTGSTTNSINKNNVNKSSSMNRNTASNANASSTPNSKVSLSKKLKIPNVEEKLVQFIMDEIVDHGQNVKFSDIG